MDVNFATGVSSRVGTDIGADLRLVHGILNLLAWFASISLFLYQFELLLNLN